MLNSRKKIILSITVLAIIFLTLIGISYAYYVANVKGNTNMTPSLNLKSGYLAIEYSDGKTSVNNEGATTGTTGDLILTKTFSVENTGVTGAYYGIWIKNYDVKDSLGNKTTFTRPQDWTYELKAGDEIISSGQLPTEDAEILNARILSVGTKENLTLTVTYNYITLEEAESMGTTLESVDQTADQNKSLSFDVTVIQSMSAYELAKEGTLLYALKTNQPTGTESTTPGQQASTANEARIVEAEDDYGTSHVYRGNVQNNYVTYSNMCWRVLRVQGNGTIKLVLADENEGCTENPSINPSAFINSASAYIYYDTSSLPTQNITDFTPWINAFVYKTSNIPSVLESWMTDKNFDTSKLINTNYCNDLSTNETDNFQYGAYNRLHSASEATPSLKCSREEDKVNTNIALLTADEVAFAGYTMHDSVTSNYLMVDVSYTRPAYDVYYTMSPSQLGASLEDYDNTYTVGGGRVMYHVSGSLDGVSNPPDTSIRPVITIRSDVTVTTNSQENPGTHSNPYIIN